MKKTILTILALCALTFADGTPTPTTSVGVQTYNLVTLKWAGALTVTLTNSVHDTVSDVFAAQVGGVNPGVAQTLGYEITATDSASTVKWLIESKHCNDPVFLVGCDSLWTLSGFRKALGTQGITDTLPGPALINGYQAFKTSFQVPYDNLFRFRILGTVTSAKTVTIIHAKVGAQ